MPSDKSPTRQLVIDLREINRLDRAARIAARFEEMNTAQAAREARKQMHAALGLALLAVVTFLAIFHDAPARVAATVLDAEAQAGGW